MGRMKHAALALTLACAAWCALPAAAQPVYACPRYDGSTSYQGTPCVGMPSGQQPIVTAPAATAAHFRRAGDEGVRAIMDAGDREIDASGASVECKHALKSLGRTTLYMPDGACVPRTAASPAADAVDAAAR